MILRTAKFLIFLIDPPRLILSRLLMSFAPGHLLLARSMCAVIAHRKGKTLQVISLILARPPRGQTYVSKVHAVEENKRQVGRRHAQQQVVVCDKETPLR